MLALLVACGCGKFELPDPPNLVALNAAYENPSAELTREHAESILRTHLDRRERLRRVNDLQEIRAMASEFERSVGTSNDDGGDRTIIEIDGVPIRADAVVTVTARCSDDGDTRDITARIIVENSEIDPTLWGEIIECRVDVPDDAGGGTGTIWGNVSVYIPTLTTDTEPIYLIDYHLDRLRHDGVERTPWSGNLRVVGGVVEFLVADPTGATLVPFAGPDPMIVGVRASNGRWHCFPAERTCESQDSSASFSY